MRNRTGIILGSVLLISGLQAQMTGNPAGVKGNSEFTLSLSGTYLNQELAKETAVSKRVLCKAVWGATSRIDLFVTLGSVGLKLQPVTSGVTELQDKKRFAFGGGLNAELISRTDISPYSVWGSAKILRFKAEGTYYITEGIQSNTWQSDLTYDWREVQVALCVKYYFPAFRVYGGVLGWMLQRQDEKLEYWSDQWWGPDRQTYQTGMWTGGLAGIEIPLPHEYSLSLEVVAFNENNYQLMLGVSQTGLQ